MPAGKQIIAAPRERIELPGAGDTRPMFAKATGASQPSYDVSKALLESALALEAILVGAAELETATGLVLGLTMFGVVGATFTLSVSIGVLLVLGFGGETAAASIPSWLNSFTGLFTAAGAGIAGASQSQINEAASFMAVEEGVLMGRPSPQASALVRAGQAFNLGINVYDYFVTRVPMPPMSVAREPDRRDSPPHAAGASLNERPDRTGAQDPERERKKAQAPESSLDEFDHEPGEVIELKAGEKLDRIEHPDHLDRPSKEDDGGDNDNDDSDGGGARQRLS